MWEMYLVCQLMGIIDAFNNNYIEYTSKGDKEKNC